MKKSLCYFIGLLAVVSFFGCGQEEFPDVETVKVSGYADCMITIPDTADNLSENRARAIGNLVASRKLDSRSAFRVVADVRPIYDCEGNEAMYVVNYANDCGFIVLSATKQYHPLLADCESGYFDPETLPEDHPMTFWLNEQKMIIGNACQLSDSIKRLISEEWMDYNTEKISLGTLSRSEDLPELPQVYYDSLRRWSLDPDMEVYKYDDYVMTEEYRMLEEYEKQRITNDIHMYGNANYGTPERGTLVTRHIAREGSTTGPLLTTQWSQGYPFNASVPTGKPLGCAVVAAGQIMKYFKHPSSFDWDKMDDLLWDKPIFSKFLYNLGLQIGIDYNGSQQTIDPWKVEDAFRYYGYVAKLKYSHDESAIRESIIKRKPVYLRGNDPNLVAGHAWVCDGYRFEKSTGLVRFMVLEYFPTTYNTPSKMEEVHRLTYSKRFYHKYHYNWGYFGSGDGYFYDNSISFNLDGETLNFNKERMELFVDPIK